jgi:hypothetical protein
MLCTQRPPWISDPDISNNSPVFPSILIINSLDLTPAILAIHIRQYCLIPLHVLVQQFFGRIPKRIWQSIRIRQPCSLSTLLYPTFIRLPKRQTLDMPVPQEGFRFHSAIMHMGSVLIVYEYVGYCTVYYSLYCRQYVMKKELQYNLQAFRNRGRLLSESMYGRWKATYSSEQVPSKLLFFRLEFGLRGEGEGYLSGDSKHAFWRMTAEKKHF